MNKKVAFVATFGDFFTSFELSNINIYKKNNYDVYCISNFQVEKYNKHKNQLITLEIKLININFKRTPFNFDTIKNYRYLKKILKSYKFDIIDCHNAVCGVLVRRALKRDKNIKIVYTPHGFFFYKNAGFIKNILFKQIEKHYAKYTDLLVCINNEDYNNALKFKVRGNVIYVPGVGVDIDKINMIPPYDIKSEYNISSNKKIIITVGELIPRKNHMIVLEAIKEINEDFVYVIVGQGDLMPELKKVVKQNNLEAKVLFVGYKEKETVIGFLKSSDIFILPSFQEGLSVALMEAMACSLPCIVSNIRGNVDLITNNYNGYIFNPNDSQELSNKLKLLLKNDEKLKSMGVTNKMLIQNNSIKKVEQVMEQAYNKILGDVNE